MNEKVVKHVYTNRGIPIQKDKYNDYYLFLKVVIDFANDTEIWILRERETETEETAWKLLVLINIHQKQIPL